MVSENFTENLESIREELKHELTTYTSKLKRKEGLLNKEILSTKNFR